MRVSRLFVRIGRRVYPDTSVQGESAAKRAQRHMHMPMDMHRIALFSFCSLASNTFILPFLLT